MDLGALTDGPAVAVFGQEVTYTPNEGAGVTLRGIFTRRPLLANAGATEGPAMSVATATSSIFFCRSDMAAVGITSIGEGDTVDVGGDTFTVVYDEPDEQGGITLVLQRVL